MKIAHIADVHLGGLTYNMEETYDDPPNGFRAAIERAIDRGVDLILISGDLFDRRGISPKEYLMAEGALRLARDQEIPVLAIHGNHDNPGPDRPSPYHVLDRVDLLTFLDLMRENQVRWLKNPKGKVGDLEIKLKSVGNGVYLRFVEIGEYAFFGVGFRIRNIQSTLMKIPFASLSDKKRVIMLHQTIQPLFRNKGVPAIFDSEGFTDVGSLPPGFVYYALGHFHKPYYPIRIRGGVGAYSGSLCRFSIDDASAIWTEGEGASFRKDSDRGFLIVDLDSSSLEFIRVPFRDLFEIEMRAETLEEALNKALRGIKECYRVIEENRGRVEFPPVVNIKYLTSRSSKITTSFLENAIYQTCSIPILLRLIKIHEESKVEEILREIEEIKTGKRDPIEIAKQRVLKDSPSEIREAIDVILENLGGIKSVTSGDERVKRVFQALMKIFFPDWEEFPEKAEEKVKVESKGRYGDSATLLRGEPYDIKRAEIEKLPVF